jgi:uncharacterized protein
LVHFEFASTNPSATRKFLERVFDWKFANVPGVDYFPFGAPSGPGGAVMPASVDRPIGVLNYLLSREIDADLRRIEAAGGRLRVPRTEIPGVGWWAMFEEPGGCVLAIFQAASTERGPIARYRD